MCVCVCIIVITWRHAYKHRVSQHLSRLCVIILFGLLVFKMLESHAHHMTSVTSEIRRGASPSLTDNRKAFCVASSLVLQQNFLPASFYLWTLFSPLVLFWVHECSRQDCALKEPRLCLEKQSNGLHQRLL